MGEGWDNSVWLVDERWVFRFPRRAIALAGVEREIAVLPRLAPLLPLPVPEPAFVGRPAGSFPWPFFGCELIQGRELADADLSDPARHRLAGRLGSFLRALTASRSPPRLPADPMGRADMRQACRARTSGSRRSSGSACGPARCGRALARRGARAPAGAVRPRSCTATCTCATCSSARTARLAGVIDWGDLCRADPAADLSLFWSLLPGAARAAFLDAYGPLTDDQLLRARVLALFLCTALAVYAHHERMPRLEREALAGLGRTCED